MSLLTPFAAKILPSQDTPNCITFLRDYSAAGLNYSPLTYGINRPYLTVTNAAVIPLIGSFLIDTLNVQSSNVSKNFNCARSMSFNFRPFFDQNDLQGQAFSTNYPFMPTVILYNQRTGQIVHIRSGKIPVINATVGAVTQSYVPYSLSVQGCIPFYFELDDALELCYINPNAENFGKLTLNFFNFNQPAYTDTGVDAIVEVTAF